MGEIETCESMYPHVTYVYLCTCETDEMEKNFGPGMSVFSDGLRVDG